MLGNLEPIVRKRTADVNIKDGNASKIRYLATFPTFRMKFAATSCALAKLVFPAAQQSKRFEAIRDRMVVVGSEGRLDAGFIDAQKRIHCLFMADRGRQGRLVGARAWPARPPASARARRSRARRRARNGCSKAYIRGRNEPACSRAARRARRATRASAVACLRKAARNRSQRACRRKKDAACRSGRLAGSRRCGRRCARERRSRDTSSAGLAMLTRSPSFRRCVRCSIRSPAGP